MPKACLRGNENYIFESFVTTEYFFKWLVGNIKRLEAENSHAFTVFISYNFDKPNLCNTLTS